MPTSESITVMFTDLVGSTELNSRLSGSEATSLRSIHFGILRRAISGADGREVKNLGDGLMAVFPTASSAVEAAVVMQQRVAENNKRASVPLAIRIGISAGEAIVEDGDYFGDPVVEAARLCAAADSGQILVGGVVRIMTRGKGARYGEVRELSLKGISAPVPACEVLWDPTTPTGSIPLQWRTAIVPRSGVVGRAIEQNALLEAAKSVAYGEGRRVFLVSGEAGMGKTTLISQAARLMHGEGMSILYGTCDEDAAVPYRPFVEALDHLAVNAPEEWMKGLDPHRLGQLARIVPAFQRRLPDLNLPRSSEPEAERYLLFAAVANLLEAVSAEEPLVLVLEDLHWADRPTIQLLRHLLFAPLGRVLVVGTYRDFELRSTDPLTEALGTILATPGVEKLPLSGFDLSEVIELLEAQAGHEMDENGRALARSVWLGTEGNPLFVAEMLRHLTETGSIVQDFEGRWRAPASVAAGALPDTVRAVVRARASQLVEGAVPTLSAAAVLGNTFELTILAAVTALEEDKLLDQIESAEQLALVAESPDVPGQFRFRHALVQQTFYRELNQTRRRSVHRRAADVIESMGGSLVDERSAEVAQHYLMAGESAEPDRTIEACRRAGQHALEVIAPGEALRWFDEAVAVAERSRRDDDHTMAALLTSLGEAKRQAGDPSFRETFLEAADRARSAGAGEVLVAGALANNRGFASASGVVDPERLAVLEDALDAVGPSDSTDRARLLAHQATELTYAVGEEDRRLEVAQEARSLASRLGDPATLLRVLNMTFHTSWTMDSISERTLNTSEAVRLAHELGDPVAAFWAALWRSFTVLEQGDGEETTRELNRVRELAAAVGQPTLRWISRFTDAMWAAIRGSADECERLATEALQLGNDTGQPDALPIFGGQLLSFRWHQGRLAEVVDMISEIAAANPGIPAYRAAKAFCLSNAGRDQETIPLVEQELELGFEHPNTFARGVHLALWSEVVARIEHQAAATALLPRLLPHTMRVEHDGVGSRGPFAHFAGILAATIGDLDSAESHLSTSMRLSERLGAPFFAARSMLELARVLVRRSNAQAKERADALLAETLDLAERHGCPLVAERARAAQATLR